MSGLEGIKETIRKISSNIAGTKSVLSFITLSDSLAQRTIIANFALMYSQANVKTIIIDSDFSQDSIAQTFGIKNSLGLSDYLSNRSMVAKDIVNKVPEQWLSVISSGTLSHGDTKYLIGDPRLELLLNELSKEYDLVLINTPLVNSKEKYMEQKSTFQISDGVILVSRVGIDKKKNLFSLAKNLNNDKIKLLGYINAER